MNKKHQVIEKIYQICRVESRPEFHNDLVKDISRKIDFGNPFDATKFDNKQKLPPSLIADDMAIVHLGGGMHRFIKGIDKVFHDFEPIIDAQDWVYKKSLLNQFNTSESNILSVANNQRIMHHFLFDEGDDASDDSISKQAKTYLPHRTKTSFQYKIGDVEICANKIQLEVDLTIELDGNIFVFEAKNGMPDNFSIYQLYHPFLYYINIEKNHQELHGKVKNIFGVYVVRDSEEEYDILKLWIYTFNDPWQMDSIRLIKSRSYKLISE